MLKFDASYYLNKYPDVAAAVAAGQTTAEAHFLTYGQAEGRNPNAYFNPVEYVQLYSDLAAQGKGFNAWAHYVTFGANEGRIPSAEFSNFNAAKYLESNSDLTAAGLKTDAQALDHYLTYGIKESRVAYNKDGSVLTFVTGKTFTLTANSDAITGTTGNDTIAGVNNGTVTQFTTTDVINGGAGTDKLVLELNADYGGGASISNIEVLQLTGTAADVDFNAAGISGIQEVIWNATGTTPDITNLGSAANITIQNDATGQTYGVAYADSAVAGSADAVKLTLNSVTGAATINLNNTTATTGATGIETLTVDLAGAAGSATNTVALNTNATASLKKLVVTGAGAGNLTIGTNITTTATTIDAAATTGGLTLAGIGAAAHTITLGSGNDSVDMGGNLTSADTVKGGAGTDTIASTAANWNTLNTAAAALATVSEFETLRVTDDAGASATIDAALVGAVNLRLAGQAGGETVTVNNLGGSTGTANVRLDDAVTGVTLNVKDATLPGSANVVNLDVRGTSATSTFTMNGVETVNVDASNAVTAHTLAMTDAALTTLKVTNTGTATFNTGTLGTNVSSVDVSGVTGGGAVTITLNGTANTGANVTGSAGVDNITGSDQLDVINSGAGNDVINQSAGNDRINVGTGTDQFNMVDDATNNTAVTITSGTTIDCVAENFDIVTGMSAGDIIRLDNSSATTGFDTVGTLAVNQAITAVAFNTTFADNGANLIRGTYNSSTGLFTISATGSDSLFVADVDATAGGTVDYSGVVLVGYATAATAANLVAAGGNVDFTLIA